MRKLSYNSNMFSLSLFFKKLSLEMFYLLLFLLLLLLSTIVTFLGNNTKNLPINGHYLESTSGFPTYFDAKHNFC